MMKQKILEAIGIFFFSVVLALTINHFRSDGLSLFRTASSLPSVLSENEAEGEGVSGRFLLAKIGQPGVAILDACSPKDFREGHVPGAKNIPYGELSEELAKKLTQLPCDTQIITYCYGIECSSAEELALLLEEMGYKDVRVFAGGWEEWTENKMPVEKE